MTAPDQGGGPGRSDQPLPMPAFVAIFLCVCILTILVAVSHSIWAFAGLIGMVVIVFAVRTRWTGPGKAEGSNRVVERIEPKVWLILGWAEFVMGVLGLLIALTVIVLGVARGEYEYAAWNVLGIPLAILLLVSGRWLIRNRRDPFSSTEPPAA